MVGALKVCFALLLLVVSTTHTLGSRASTVSSQDDNDADNDDDEGSVPVPAVTGKSFEAVEAAGSDCAVLSTIIVMVGCQAISWFHRWPRLSGRRMGYGLLSCRNLP